MTETTGWSWVTTGAVRDHVQLIALAVLAQIIDDLTETGAAGPPTMQADRRRNHQAASDFLHGRPPVQPSLEGERVTLADWCGLAGVSVEAFRDRVRHHLTKRARSARYRGRAIGAAEENAA